MARASVNSAAEVCKRGPGRPCDVALQVRRREEILCAASRAFAKVGYRNTDVEAIAEGLGVAKGTVYRYFGTKEKLFLEAVERGVRCLDEHIHAAVAGVEDGVERMVVATRAYLEFFERYPQLVELFIQERAEFRDRKPPIYFQITEAQREPWRRHLDDLIAQGRLRRIPPEKMQNVICDLLYGTMFTNYLSGRKKPFDAQARDIVDVFFNGILSDGERRLRQGK